ncbi:MAG: zinc-ribbon domain-containing protein [Nitrososphaerales archaeon]|nr:zinc-ribbon domain-containing protein [Nitrososphaerales archaeon]
MSYVKREDVTGKKVITPDGNSLGVVKDLAFSTDGSVGLVVSKKDDSETVVPIRQTTAIGEFILLSTKPAEKASPSPGPQPAPMSSSPTACPSCGKPVKPGAKFCGKCGYKLA